METNIQGIELNKDLFCYTGITDSKHILNTCNKVVSQSILDKIESGITLEDLDNIRHSGLDIFHYQTQITIHGLFPELGINYFGGYKCLFQNKNKSIGVRWSAIDYEKLKYIYSECKLYGFHIHRNSNEYFIYKYKYIKSRQELDDCASVYNNEAKNIDSSLFYGSINIYPARTMFGVICRYDININAIYQKNIETVIEQITGANKETREQLRLKIEQDADAESKRLEAERLQRKNDLLAKRELFLSTDNLNWELRVEPAKVNLIFARINNDNNGWNFYKVTKVAKKYIYYRECDKQGNISGYEQSSLQKNIKAYFAPVVVSVKEPVNINITIIDYSDKAIAIIGDTKPFKDKLQSIGCKFNPYLKCGSGWIAQKSKLNEIKQSLNL